jgi:hypothetical protein
MKDHGVSSPLFHLRYRVGNEIQAGDFVIVGEQRFQGQRRNIIERVERSRGVGASIGVRI